MPDQALGDVKFLRFENLREDLYRVLKSLVDFPSGLAEAINVGKRTRYQDFYDEKLCELIASKDQELIERFSYTFSPV